MNERNIGWALVAVQAVLLGALILLPGRSDWATPDWLRLVSSVLFFGGLVLMGVAALGLGRSLTPTPVPVSYGELETGGLYRWMRHPIYTGVLTLVLGMVIRSGSWIQLLIGVLTFVFFDRKARWEEQRLAEHYPGYANYAATTPRFVPQPWRSG